MLLQEVQKSVSYLGDMAGSRWYYVILHGPAFQIYQNSLFHTIPFSSTSQQYKPLKLSRKDDPFNATEIVFKLHASYSERCFSTWTR